MVDVHLREVYGIARDVPRNYVVRPGADGALVDSLTRDQHLVIYGSSKQGKTCLRKWNLTDDDYIVVTCSNKWNVAQLHSAILKAAGYTIEQSTKRTFTGGNKISATFSGGVNVGAAHIGGRLSAGNEGSEATEISEVALELDPFDVNDIISALSSIEFTRYIVLEDFHYLPQDTQKDFAVALKAFHEGSDLCFIVVGVWLDENRLIQYNGDLTGRVSAINADAWSVSELRQVIAAGEDLLNIQFDRGFVEDLVNGCFESVYIVQECCYRACEESGVFSTQQERVAVGSNLSAADLIREVVDSQSARYNAFISNFSSGFKKSNYEMYRWLLVPVLLAKPEELEAGLSYNHITQVLARYHPQGRRLNPGNVTQALQATASLQVHLDIKPIILDYDQTNRRLNVVDRGFLIWRQHQSDDALFSAAGLEVERP